MSECLTDGFVGVADSVDVAPVPVLLELGCRHLVARRVPEFVDQVSARVQLDPGVPNPRRPLLSHQRRLLRQRVLRRLRVLQKLYQLIDVHVHILHINAKAGAEFGEGEAMEVLVEAGFPRVVSVRT